MMPLFGSRNIPILPKIGLSLLVSLILLPVVEINSSSMTSGPVQFVIFLLGEGIIGFLIGFSVRLVFSGIQLAGEIMGLQIGFSMANLLDPQSGIDSTVTAQFNYFFALLAFLSIDGHHWFFKAIAQSFQILSPGGITFKEVLYQHFVILSGRLFQIAIKMIAPIMAILIFTHLAMGIVARMIPQINLLISSFPITICLGLLILGFSIDLIWPFIKGLLEESGKGLVYTLLPLLKR
jgi:flagellar biosynthetic protein FliR